MASHKVRRLPVIDGHRPVGHVPEASPATDARGRGWTIGPTSRANCARPSIGKGRKGGSVAHGPYHSGTSHQGADRSTARTSGRRNYTESERQSTPLSCPTSTSESAAATQVTATSKAMCCTVPDSGSHTRRLRP